jgi:membrane protein required for colicin V production
MAWQIASLASLVVSYFAALRFSEQLAPHIPYVGDQAPLNRFAAMLVIYVGVSFIIWTLFRLVAGAIDKVRLESFDRQLGAMFGLAKGVLLCVAITFFAVTLLPPAQGEAIVSSQSGRYIVALLDKSHSVFPPEVHQIVDPYLNSIEQRLNPNFQPHAHNVNESWPRQAQAQQPVKPSQPTAAWPQINWPQPQPARVEPRTQWPTQSEPSPYQGADPYRTPREPNPFPSPYSAGAPTNRDY